MDKHKLFSIGDVARLFHLSVGSLRHYESLGLLTPEYIDPDSGYRYYSVRQFEVLNSIRYLRALDMPLSEIAELLADRDIDRIEQGLLAQRRAVMARQAELERISRKLDNRLRMLADARGSVLDRVLLTHKDNCRMIRVDDRLRIGGFLDMEAPIRKLDREQTEAVVFLGKVGVSIDPEHLMAGRFDCYDGIFLILDEEDRFEGETLCLPATDCVSIRFRGSHTEAPPQYKKLMDYIAGHGLELGGFSREITLIDYGITGDPEKFVTEISIPIK